ncbi:MAG: winged helix-turn-helix domain-containing protein [Candidatus Nitrosopolaris sp.]
MSLQNVNEFNNGILTNLFSSRAVAQILDFFLDHKEFDYPPSEIAKKTGLSFRTVFREIPSLERNQLIFNNRKIGKTNMYKLNTDFEAVVLLERFVLDMSQLRPTKETNSQSTEEDISESEINLDGI